VYQAGTLSGNPIAMIAGYTLLTELKKNPVIYEALEEKGRQLKEGIDTVLKAAGEPFVINQLGSMISVHFSEQPVTDFATAAAADNTKFSRLFHALLAEGIYLPPSAFESWFLNNALSSDDMARTVEAIRKFR
ncbi:MAG TPA: aspartate aminotransferase family protein, partial [Flavihumibacter sp.]|nr:aspartate aminotransferase family protein [Flavihumibacter sp.]